MSKLEKLTIRSSQDHIFANDQKLRGLICCLMSDWTHSKESATRKKVDKKLIDLDWIIDEEKSDCNVFTERAKTHDAIEQIKRAWRASIPRPVT